jgi:hypothetical protein
MNIRKKPIRFRVFITFVGRTSVERFCWLSCCRELAVASTRSLLHPLEPNRTSSVRKKSGARLDVSLHCNAVLFDISLECVRVCSGVALSLFFVVFSLCVFKIECFR